MIYSFPVPPADMYYHVRIRITLHHNHTTTRWIAVKVMVPCMDTEAVLAMRYYILEAVRTMKPWQLVLLSALHDSYCREYGCNCAIDVPTDDELVAKGAAAYALTELL